MDEKTILKLRAEIEKLKKRWNARKRFHVFKPRFAYCDCKPDLDLTTCASCGHRGMEPVRMNQKKRTTTEKCPFCGHVGTGSQDTSEFSEV